MRLIDTSSWAKCDGWRIAPDGLDWIDPGSRIICADGVRIGNDASIGSYARIADGASIGNDVCIGNDASVGPRSSDAVDIGWADGYRKCIAQVDGVAYIGAGCRWFTLAQALKHWDNKPDRVLTMCLMNSAIAIAKSKGWNHGNV